VFREASAGGGGVQVCACACGVRILLRGIIRLRALPPAPAAQPSALGLSARSRLREGVRHVVHLPPPEGLSGYVSSRRGSVGYRRRVCVMLAAATELADSLSPQTSREIGSSCRLR
jgi:hypothetical protein